MKIIVISYPKYIYNEIEIINELFEKGLETFHLRKPFFSIDEYRNFLNKINLNFHNRIVLSHHHKLIYDFDLKGIHFTEKERKERVFLGYEKINCVKTTSFHSEKDIINNKYNWNYYFLSPFYNSISKENYKSKKFDLTHLNKNKIVPLGLYFLEIQ